MSAEESKKDGIYFAVCADLSAGAKKGGLTDEERAALAERYGVSEALLLRCERASQAYGSVMGEERRIQARLEALRHVSALGKEPYGDEFWEERLKALRRIEAAMPEPEKEIIRESKAAANALLVALDLPPAWDLPPEEDAARRARRGKP